MIKLLYSLLLMLACLGTGLAQEEKLGQFKEFHYVAEDSKERPYIVYIPSTVKKEEQRPLIVYLHGAIASPTIKDNPVEGLKKSRVLELLEQCRCYALFPYGQKGATWFDDIGINMVMGELDVVLKEFPIQKNKIFLSGFSDGASGTLYIASTLPTRFAGFIAFNGSYAVAARLGKDIIYPENLANRPLYMVNTQSDMLYPAEMMRPLNQYLQKYAPQIILSEPEGEHDLRYLSKEIPALLAFIDNHQLDKNHRISWEASRESQIDWIKVEGIDEQAVKKEWHQPYQLSMRNTKASFGIQPDRNYTKGLKIAGFSDRSTAKEMGAKQGDIVIKMGDVELKHPYDSYRYLAQKKAGEATTLVVERDGKQIELKGQFLPAYDYEVFERRATSAKIKAQIIENVLHIETSGLKGFSIDMSQLPAHIQRIQIK